MKIHIQEGHDGPGLLTWKNLNQMLNVTIYITKIWPSELFFLPYPTYKIRKNIKISGKVLWRWFLAFHLAWEEQDCEVC